MDAERLDGAAPPAGTRRRPPPISGLDIGALPGSTRFGLLKDPIHLSDFKGKTVVLAFFFKARTRG